MFKLIMLSVSLIICVSVIGFAQNKNDNNLKDPHSKIDTSKVLKINESKETVSEIPWNKVCPVKGNQVDEESPTVEYNGKVYGFCCPGCDSKFKKDPEKYSQNLSEDGKRFVAKK